MLAKWIEGWAKFYRFLFRNESFDDKLNIYSSSNFANLSDILIQEEKLVKKIDKNDSLRDLVSNNYKDLIDKKREWVDAERTNLKNNQGYFFDSVFKKIHSSKMTKVQVFDKFEIHIKMCKEYCLSKLRDFDSELAYISRQLEIHGVSQEIIDSSLDRQNKILKRYKIGVEDAASLFDLLGKKEINFYRTKKSLNAGTKLAWWSAKKTAKGAAYLALIATILTSSGYIVARGIYETLPKPQDSKFVILVAEPKEPYEVLGSQFIDIYTLRLGLAMNQQVEAIYLPAYRTDFLRTSADSSVQKMAVLSHGSWTSCALTDGDISESMLSEFMKDYKKKNGLFLRHTCSDKMPGIEAKFTVDDSVKSEFLIELTKLRPFILGLELKVMSVGRRRMGCEISFADICLKNGPFHAIHIHNSSNIKNKDVLELISSYERKILDEHLYSMEIITPENTQLGASVMSSPNKVHGWKGNYQVGPWDWLITPIPEPDTFSMCTRYPLLEDALDFVLPYFKNEDFKNKRTKKSEPKTYSLDLKILKKTLEEYSINNKGINLKN